MEDLLRILGVAAVGLMLVLPSGEYLDSLAETNTQVIVGIVVVVSVLFIDAVFGALLGLAVLIWMFKMNHRILFIKSLARREAESKDMRYGTAKNLVDAQTNVINEKMMDTEMIGFNSVYGEQVIGAQGLDKNMPGFDKSGVGFLAPLDI